MALNATPSVACIGIIGRHDEPLHISIFPPYDPSPSTSNPDYISMSTILHSSLDLIDLRLSSPPSISQSLSQSQPPPPISPDLGLLHALDERLCVYAYLTNSNIKFLVVVDMLGRPPPANVQQSVQDLRRVVPVVGLKYSDLRPVWRALRDAWVKLCLNPFWKMDLERTPLERANREGKSNVIRSRGFEEEVRRIGRAWAPGVVNV